MLAKDIMIRDVLVAKAEDRVEEAARLMVENKVSGIPVVDENSRVVGIITEKDLMIKAKELRVPFYVTLFDSIIFLENPIRFNNDVKKYTAVKVKEAMTKDVLLVEEDTPITQIIEIMQNKRVNRVPVVRHGKLVGIISRNDILKSLIKSDE